MFEQINKYKIRIRENNALHYIPNIISMHPLDDLFTATDWLFHEALDDYNSTHARIDARRKKEGYSQQNIDDIDLLSIRLGSRTQGYVNQLCLMEDILIFEYKRMAQKVMEASGNKIHISPEQDYQELKDRFNSVRIFRNKVIAHTAYTYPKKEDNPETIVRSILNLFPEPGMITLGNNMFSGFSPYRSQLPIISIFEWEEKTKPIFQDWHKLFILKLREIGTGCPLENPPYCIEVVYPRNH